MKIIEILVNGEVGIMTAAATAHEAGIEIAKYRPLLEAVNPGAEIAILIDGEERKEEPVVDVRRIARNMKTAYIEGRCMNDMDIC